MGRTRTTSEARQRILETADRLFYQEGVRAVGIDRIIAEAEVAKMSLYRHFESKDDLILAVLQHREATFQALFEGALQRYTAELNDPLLAFFAALKEWFQSPGFRGCPFINTAVELADVQHPCSEFVRAHTQRFAGFLRSLVEQRVGREAARLACAISLLVTGAIVTAVLQGKADAADVARDAALQLVAEGKGA